MMNRYDAKQEPILHGGDLCAAERHFGRPAEGWVDMSTGINPWAYVFDPLPEACWQRLPEADSYGALIEVARHYYGNGESTAIPDGTLIAAPGTQALIQWLARVRPTGRVGVVSPTYGEHARAWRHAGHRVETLDAPEDGAGDCDVVIVVNPNNPDGRVWNADRLCLLGERMHARGGWLIVDEAFADVMPECSVAGRATDGGIIVLKSFGKFFGLAGVRLGFAVASRKLCERLLDVFGPWHVSGPALEIARQALSDARWVDDTRARLKESMSHLDGLLRNAGLMPIGGTDLFRLVRVPQSGHGIPRAFRLFEALARSGILVRRFDDHADWLRFGLPGAPRQWSRFEKSLLAAVSL